jgi:hypothetical protein
MLKRVQHDKKKHVIPNLFRNLEFGNDNEFIAFALVRGRFRCVQRGHYDLGVFSAYLL